MTAQSANKAGNETAEQDDFFAKPEQAGNHDEFFTNYSAPAPGYTAPGAAPANQWSAPNTWAPGNPPQQAASEEKNSLALAGFICAFFIPLLGWIFGGIGLSRAKRCGDYCGDGNGDSKFNCLYDDSSGIYGMAGKNTGDIADVVAAVI